MALTLRVHWFKLSPMSYIGAVPEHFSHTKRKNKKTLSYRWHFVDRSAVVNFVKSCIVVPFTATLFLIGISQKECIGEPIVVPIATLSGTIDPITYTDSMGTFTTSPITVSLASLIDSLTSFVSVDFQTGTVSNRLVLGLSFNNGKAGPLNEDLSGFMIVDESGFLSESNGQLSARLSIQQATLSGAGPFNGTKAAGNNPVIFPDDLIIIRWMWDVGDIHIDLRAGFINGNNTPTKGIITATLTNISVPEPASISLLSGALLTLIAFARRLSRY
jgi:hypothetical protein